jgi:hypothetical protein
MDRDALVFAWGITWDAFTSYLGYELVALLIILGLLLIDYWRDRRSDQREKQRDLQKLCQFVVRMQIQEILEKCHFDEEIEEP